MIKCRPIAYLVAPNTSLEVHKGLAVNLPYSQDVGLVMYMAMNTWSNLAFNLELVLRFARYLGEVHLKAVKRILIYLQATTNMSLVYGGSSNKRLVKYANADYACCTTIRCSTSRYVFFYCWATLGWRSKKIECVALSTTKAEYISLWVATEEVLWLWGPLGFLGGEQRKPTAVY